jgi:diaminopimelate decarboxylase
MSKLKYESPVIKKMNAGLMNKFGTRTEYHPVKQIDGVAVKEIIAKYGSPVFVL